MRALTDKQRMYVFAMASDPFGNPTQWARAAGYSDASEGAKVKGHYLSHDPKVEEAVKEFSKTAMGTLGPFLATAGLLRLARDKDHPDHTKALIAIANRVGLHETTEHHVTVTRTLTADEKMDRLLNLAKKHGLDPQLLLGGNSVSREARAGVVVEHEAKDG